MQWDTDAESLLRQTPDDARDAIRSKVEQLASEKGCGSVSVKEFQEARSALHDGGSVAAEVLIETRGLISTDYLVVKTCRSTFGCSRQVIDPQQLTERLIQTFEKSGFSQFIEERSAGTVLTHKKFRMALSGCPNGCSQPQIVDFGVLGRAIPEITQVPCNECKQCVSACEENAIQIIDADPDTDYITCAACGDCARACPTGTIIASRRGYCIKLGGTLGRHPQLGQTIIPLATDDEVVAALSASLELYMQSAEKGESFCDVVNRLGLDAFGQAIGERIRGLHK
jgi:dissimilatory sulfite reductase (desulfoviridin) alpha/beta subunit